jgi:transcriptional regulator of arginine metabolism
MLICASFLFYAHTHMPIDQAARSARQQAILDILQEQTVTRQAEVVALLQDRGIPATQSSVSRDLRQLGIAKLDSGYGEARSTPAGDNPRPPGEFLRGTAAAGSNLLVLRTAVGAAARVAVYLDRAGWSEIVGTVSGDDTVFVATDNAAAQRRLQARLRAEFAIDEYSGHNG